MDNEMTRKIDEVLNQAAPVGEISWRYVKAIVSYTQYSIRKKTQIDKPTYSQNANFGTFQRCREWFRKSW